MQLSLNINYISVATGLYAVVKVNKAKRVAATCGKLQINASVCRFPWHSVAPVMSSSTKRID